MKDFIELILPYYGICVVILTMTIILVSFTQEIIIQIFGSCIHLEEVDMTVRRKDIKTVQRTNGEGKLDVNKKKYYLYLEHPNNPGCYTDLEISERLYRRTYIGDTIKMHEIIYKYKDSYIKRVKQFSNHNISKYNKCSDSDKNSYNLFKEEILNKCYEHDKKSADKMQKVFPLLAIPIVLLFLMVFYINS